MPKWRLYLTGGHTKVLKARTPRQAEHKYYASDNHFRTERSVLRVKKFRR